MVFKKIDLHLNHNHRLNLLPNMGDGWWIIECFNPLGTLHCFYSFFKNKFS